MKKEERRIESFDKIKFKDFGTLILTQGDQASLTIEADEELLDQLISEVRGGTLVLGVDDDWLNRIGTVISSLFSNGNHKVVYHLTFVDLKKIGVSGQCNLECASLQTDTLDVSISGLGDLNFDHLNCDRLDVSISGRGEFNAAGRVKHQQIRISGSGEYRAPELASDSLRIVVSGQGNATVRVENDLDITISGLGHVEYYGRPKLRQVISGLGKTKRLNAD
jgi:hypothetical protein